MKKKITLNFKKASLFLMLTLLGTFSFAQDLIITTEVCAGATEVRMTGPWWGWNPAGGPIAVDNGNGTFTFTLSPAPTADMEYLLVKDGVQENLIQAMVDGGTCAPITDYVNYANRQWLTTEPLTINNTYGQCGPCAASSGLNLTIEICGSTTPDTVRMTGPFWGWDPNGGPLATDNGNGTWTVNLNPVPTADMEYLFVVDGVQENLIADMQNGGTCAPVTDYTNYANRKWTVGDGDVTGISFDRCVSCSVADLIITTEICDAATSVNLTGPIWGWNPAFGPQAVDNGNGTWTFTLSPAPADTLEYLLVKNGVMENLVSAMVNGGTCAPVTDYASYANRQWITGQGAVSNTYGLCGTCATQGLNEFALTALEVYPNPTTGMVTFKRESLIETIAVYSLVGEKVMEIAPNATSIEIDLKGLAPGVYQVVATGTNASSRSQIIKE
ncbi:MAG: T9SS type A sorting domain-containing protein [Crocinitomicaceae bacterium]